VSAVGSDAPEVLTAGEAMGTVRADGLVRLGGTARLSVAGAEANVAIGLARLGHRARWVGVVGPDQLGELVLRTLRAEGVDVGCARRGTAPTGIMVREDRVAGLARVDYHRHASAGRQLDAQDLLAALTPAPRVAHLTGITMALGPGPAEAVCAGAKAAREAGATVCFDVNHRSRLWTTEQAAAAFPSVLDAVDVLVASADELPLVAPGSADERSAADTLLSGGVREVVVTHGAGGATVWTPDGSVHAPARAVDVVDSIGAGDAFVAGYLSGLLEGLDVADRLARAVAAGAFSVATSGDWEGLPNREELALLEQQAGFVLR
jgi:2-dehydro-3-deoxygluconokinase